jgi:predicted Zn-dependent protease
MKPRTISRLCLLLGSCLLLAQAAAPARAGGGGMPDISVIRDTEIEHDIRGWMTPVFKAAEMDPAGINIILVQSDQINSFVAGGPNIFLFTGLLLKTENEGEIIGVAAHELGHIRGGHLSRGRSAMEAASYETVLATLLGIGAAALSGEGGFAAAGAGAGQSMALRNYLSFSRVQESSADQAALTFLQRSRMTPAGLLSFMQKLGDQELLPADQQTEYVQTHPLTRDRVEAIRAGLERSPYAKAKFPASWDDQYARCIAKLTGFLMPQQVEWKYDSADHSIPADYARAIALYRQNKVAESLAAMDALIAREPDNPYFLELKGQALFEFGRVEASLAPYRKAVGIMPEAYLIRTAYGHALIESSGRDPKRLGEAIDTLNRALRDDPHSSYIRRLLATAYGRQGNEPMAQLNLAEESVLRGDRASARAQAKEAASALPKGSQGWLRAQDILNEVQRLDKKE